MSDMFIPNNPKPEINWDIDRRIFIKENVFNDQLCDELIEYGSKNVVRGINKYPDSFSISFHSCLLPLNHTAHKVLQDTWKEINDFFNIEVDFVEPYELKRYTANDHFGKHVDNYHSLTIDLDRKLTLSVQLSNDDDYDGGEFRVVTSTNKLKRGSVIAFPSFFPHAIEKVSSGIRWSLIGWAWGRYWK